jgi:cytidylate kinase
MNRHPIIAVDGPAASGKSSVSRLLAERLGFSYVNSGAFYRGATFLALQLGGGRLVEPGELMAALKEGRLQGELTHRRSVVLLDGRVLDKELAAGTVNSAVSMVSAWPEVRAWLLEHLRSFARQDALVMEGRDIGSVVFPQADCKFYLDANPLIRQRRRAAQGIGDEIGRRDELDSSRVNAPLMMAADAIRLDSTDLSLEQVVEKLYQMVQQALA